MTIRYLWVANLAISILAFPLELSAQEANECSSVSNDIARLECYDSAFQTLSQESVNKPISMIRELYDSTRSGSFGYIRHYLITNNYLDEYDQKKLIKLFTGFDREDISLIVTSQKRGYARVKLQLRRGSKLFTGPPFEMIFTESRWKIDYSGISWPAGLQISKFK